jgi:hypothetical protein
VRGVGARTADEGLSSGTFGRQRGDGKEKGATDGEARYHPFWTALERFISERKFDPAWSARLKIPVPREKLIY